MAPRPGDEDEDWEDDFADFKAATPGAATADAAPVSSEDDFGSFTQISMPATNDDDHDTGDAGMTSSATVPVMTQEHSSHHGPPVVETVGDFSEFSQSETTEDVAVRSTTMSASRTESVVSDDAPDEKATPAAAENEFQAPVDKVSAGQQKEKEEVLEDGNDDSFGDFGGFSDPTSVENMTPAMPDLASSPADAVENKESNKNDPAVANVMDVGDFSALENVPTTAATVSSPPDPVVMESLQNGIDEATKSDVPVVAETVDNSDSFGDFDTALVESSGVPLPTEPVEDKDTWGDFGTSEVSKTKTGETLPAVETADNSDSFGDFGSADLATTTSLEQGDVAVKTEAVADDALDAHQSTPAGSEDSDFGAAEPALNTNTDHDDVDAAQSAPTTSKEDDDFGDFGGAQSASKAMKDDDDFGDIGGAKSVPTSSNKDDDFGAFGAAESALTAGSEGNDFGADQSAEKARNEEDEFGDFGAAQSAETSKNGDDSAECGAVKSPEEVNDDDDEFGDFGAAEFVSTVKEDDDNDFGDFDAAEPTHVVAKDEDHDDFGDFDAAGSTPVVEKDEDDDFGDFGAADSAPTTNKDGHDDDFGDFNDVDDPPEAQVTSPATQHPSSSLSASDPLLQNVAAAMHRMFQKPSSLIEVDSKEDPDDASDQKSSIAELMKSMQETDKPLARSDELPSFWDMLKQSNLLRKGDSQIIVTGKPPYRLHYPLHGFTSIHETKKPPEARRASIPAVLNVKLHASHKEPEMSTLKPNETQPKSPLPAPVPAPAPSPSPAAPTSNGGTVVQLPPKKSTEDPARVDSFLKKIPNLSFMLSPALSLPAQS